MGKSTEGADDIRKKNLSEKNGTFPLELSTNKKSFFSSHFHLIDISRFGISIIKWKLNVSFLIALIFSVVKLKMVFSQRKTSRNVDLKKL